MRLQAETRSPTPTSPRSVKWPMPSWRQHTEGDFEALLEVLDPDVVLRRLRCRGRIEGRARGETRS